MEWSDQLCTGVREIDEQHREMLLRLGSALEKLESGGDPEEIRCHLDETGAYIIEHFCFEERMLKEQRSAFYEEHKKRHDQFIFRYQDLRDRFDMEGASAVVREELGACLDWLTTHFVEFDRQLAPRLPLSFADTYASLN